MVVYAGLAAAAGRITSPAITIGNFDGVHLGHRRLIALAQERAAAVGGEVTALTFWPHPATVLAPRLAPPMISARARHRELLAEAGVQAIIEQPFTAEFAKTSPDEFASILLDQVKARAVVVGYDFTYGRARGGTTETLRQACEARGATLDVAPAVTVNGLVASSTKVREFVLAGNVSAAAQLLGRPFDLTGTVVHGAARGRTIGVPTANLDPETDGGQTRPLVPGIGVYASLVWMPDGSIAQGATNVGLNPTFHPESTTGPESRAISIETHILDRNEDLYGKQLRVAFVQLLRPERRFPTVESLVAQIRQDIDDSRRILSQS
jgi:riboflavin kinase/FMN adenylyltransferase